MASTYSTKLRFELPTNGEQSTTWGNTVNTNIGTLLEQAVAGWAAVDFPTDANITTTTSNGGSDESRNAAIKFTSSGSLTATRNAVVPTVTKLYLIHNATTGSQSVQVKTTAGTGITIPNGAKQWVYCDGTNVVDGMTNLVTGTTLNGVALGTLATSSLVTTALITDANVTLAKMANMATDSIIGRATASTGVPEVLTTLPWANTGDVTRPADSAVTTIAAGVVTLAKMADMATDSIIGRATASTGVPQVLTALPFAFTGDVTRPADSNVTTIAAGVVTYAQMATASVATAAQIQAGTASKLLDSEAVLTATNVETISYSASLALDFTTFINAKVTLTGNITFANPTTTSMSGRSGYLEIVQDGTGSRTATWGSNYKFAGGTDIVLTTTASATDLIFYQILSDGTVYVSKAGDVKN